MQFYNRSFPLEYKLFSKKIMFNDVNSSLLFDQNTALPSAAIPTGCPRRNGQNFGRVFLMLNYTDITQNTYIQS